MSVTRRLANLCLAWTLVLGCWAGVLAAAYCPHTDCRPAAAAPAHEATRDAHATAAVEHATGHEGHTAHAPSH